MGKVGKINRKKSITDLLKSENIAKVAQRGVRDALKENVQLGIPVPVIGDNGKVVYLRPEKALQGKK